MASDDVAVQLEPFTFLDKSSLEAALKCSICSKYLNVSPIMFSEDTGNICGRCNSDNLENTTRQKAFEELVKNLTFPCANKGNGCLKVLKISKVQEHEESCSFQPVNCPLFDDKFWWTEGVCWWTGNSKMLGEHLRTHDDRFLDPPQFTFGNLAYQIDNIFFTIIDNQVITVAITPITRLPPTYACKVMVNGNDLESQCFRYSLKLTDEEENYSLIMKRNRLEPLSELTNHAPEKILQINLIQIRDTLKNPKTIIAKFEIEKKANNEIIQIIGNQNSNILSGGAIAISDKQKIVPSDEKMLAELECPICNEYMFPPIYICQSGHSICSDCKTTVQLCPTCRSPYGNCRNFTLEKLTETVNYPCPNREVGCIYVFTSDKINQHHINCVFKKKPCVLNCGWKGFTSDLSDHLLTSHDNQMIEPNTATLMEIKQFPHYYLLRVDGQLFMLTMGTSRSKTHNTLMVMHLGHREMTPKYIFSIQFTNKPTISYPNLSITAFCHSHLEEKELVIPEDYVLIPYAALVPYMFQNDFWYVKVSITKI